MPAPLVVATVNVNGLRAAFRRGMDRWLAQAAPDVLLLQEVRAGDADVEALLDGWHVTHQAGATAGRAGVAIAARRPWRAVRHGLPPVAGPGGSDDTDTPDVPDSVVPDRGTPEPGTPEPGTPEPDASDPEAPDPDLGRWVEADLDTDSGPLTVASVYLHSATVGHPSLAAKYAYLARATRRLTELSAARAVIGGDLNIAHREVDLKNWKGNRGSAGFLPEERAWLDRWFDELGWTDVGRAMAGPGPGPYTWWSWRGRAFDNDAGWRIDYQLVSPPMLDAAVAARVDRAPSYDTRFSDHAPLVVDYRV